MTPTEQMIVRLVDAARAATDGDVLTEPLDATSFLPEVLDSLALMALIGLVEDTWGFEVDDDEIDPAVFRTVQSLAEFVDRATSSRPAG